MLIDITQNPNKTPTEQAIAELAALIDQLHNANRVQNGRILEIANRLTLIEKNWE